MPCSSPSPWRSARGRALASWRGWVETVPEGRLPWVGRGDLAMAREAIQKTTFSLILLDVLLPDGDGVEFLGEIKKSPSTASVPVMLLSTEAEVSDRIRGLKTGADEYIGKPYDAAYVVSRSRR